MSLEELAKFLDYAYVHTYRDSTDEQCEKHWKDEKTQMYNEIKKLVEVKQAELSPDSSDEEEIKFQRKPGVRKMTHQQFVRALRNHIANSLKLKILLDQGSSLA